MAVDKIKNFELTVYGDDREYKCILKPIDRATLGVALAFVAPIHGNPDYFRAGEIILNTCWISGDDEIKTDDGLFAAAAFAVFEMIQVKKTKLQRI